MRAEVTATLIGRAMNMQRAAIAALKPSHNATPVQTRVVVMNVLPPSGRNHLS